MTETDKESVCENCGDAYAGPPSHWGHCPSCEGKNSVPSKEAVKYGRDQILSEIEWCNQMETKAKDAGRSTDMWRGASYVLSRMLGHGCVIGPCDERWLDDDFRSMMTKSRALTPEEHQS